MNQYSDDNLDLFKGLFKGRDDVFAIHWKKSKKSGYMPAYSYDPYLYRLHKMKGGTFKNYEDKTYLPLTDNQLVKHFIGEQLIGIYPLLQNNTSWFITADFDKDRWVEESRAFIEICNENNIPAYLERSRSGMGGHVWIFFDRSYPASRSRKVFIHLLEQAGIFSVFDKSSSFDRLFPNQDFHSGKGLGNLIALPFHKPALDNGNSCFVDERLKPYQNQWEFLSSIKRVLVSHLDAVYNSITNDKAPTHPNIDSYKLQIVLSNSIHLNRMGLSVELIDYLKEELNFVNSDYFIKKNTNRSTWGTERYFRFIEETENEVIVPRGFVGKLIRFCKQQQIDFEFHDQRIKQNPVKFNTNFDLRSYQKPALDATYAKDFGVITAPPGSGKTVIGLKIISEKQQPALIIVHRKHLMDQWMERIQAFLGIPKNEIGRIGQGKTKQGKKITVAMIQSLGKYLEKEDENNFTKNFGIIIVDECHHVPAKTYRNTISKLSPYYQYGLTATPFRKSSDGKLIFIHLGETISTIKLQDIEPFKRARITVRETALDVPFNPKTDELETLSKILIHDSARNKMICNDITTELNKGKKIVIITERKDHIDILNQFLKTSFEVVKLSGDDSEENREKKWKLLKSGNYQALITTGQYFGEGTDLQNASCLFLVFPFSFKGKLIQYIGRVQRSESTPIIYDYRDRKIEYLNKLFLKRNSYYRHFDRQATLFDDMAAIENTTWNTVTVDKKIKVAIEKLDFRYGGVAFKYTLHNNPSELEFEVDNDFARPEFDILKPYFSKELKSNTIQVHILIEFEEGQLVSQKASSADLDKINHEIIESVKFRFIKQDILKRDYPCHTRSNLLGIQNLQETQDGNYLFGSEDQLLVEVLKNEKVKHYRQLRYLATKHEGSILKLRFVLKPFSFLFLLSGREQYHIILETLDTEEATYIWHLEKNIQLLHQNMLSIDQDLNTIRNKGRKIFIEEQPENFSRIIHDYSDEKKGYIVWKDHLEERLI